MRKFGRYILLFFIGIGTFYAAYYCWKSYQSRLPQADIYVWGDSRMYWGLDVERLEELTDKRVCATQQEGASVYDMLTFVDHVPAHSLCIIGLSECVLYRDHASDYNRSGFNLWATWQLIKAGYSVSDVYGIIKQNQWKPKSIETIRHEYFAPADTIVTPEPMPGWVTMYHKSYPYFEAKTRCYDVAIQSLLNKGCQVVLLDFAGYKEVEKMAVGTPNRVLTDHVVNRFVRQFTLETQCLSLSANQLIYYDLSHLNELGAQMVADELTPMLQGNKYIRIIEK